MKEELIKFHSERESVKNDQKIAEFFVLNTVCAPEIKEEEEGTDQKEDKRQSLDLSCVIDRSGSMSGEKIELVKETLQFLLNELQPKDRLGVVIFDDNIETLFPLTDCTKEKKVKLSKLISSIKDNGSTNLSGGLYQGLDLLRRRSHDDKKDISSCILFTDGEANCALQNSKDILKFLEGKIAHPPIKGVNGGQKLEKFNFIANMDTTIYTFGFGGSHNADMLKDIAEKGRGMYYFIKSKEDISESFVDCLGGLLSVVMKNITVKFTPLSGCKIVKVHSVYLQDSSAAPSITVKLPDLQSEEKRNFLISMEIPSIKEVDEKFKILDIEVAYTDDKEQSVTKKITGVISRPKEEPKEQKINESIDEQKNRIFVTNQMDVIEKLADADNYKEAKKKCQETIEKIEKSVSGKKDLSKALVADIKEQMSGLNRKQYRYGGGKQKYKCQKMEMQYERCADIKSRKCALYENKKKKRLKKKYKK